MGKGTCRCRKTLACEDEKMRKIHISSLEKGGLGTEECGREEAGINGWVENYYIITNNV